MVDLLRLVVLALARKLVHCAARLKALVKALRVPTIDPRRHLRFHAAVSADILLTMSANAESRIPDGASSAEQLAAREALEDAADLRAALKARKEKGDIPWEQVKAELGLTKSKRTGKSHGRSKRRVPVKEVKGRSRIRTDE